MAIPVSKTPPKKASHEEISSRCNEGKKATSQRIVWSSTTCAFLIERLTLGSALDPADFPHFLAIPFHGKENLGDPEGCGNAAKRSAGENVDHRCLTSEDLG